jgi:hypothetical protein
MPIQNPAHFGDGERMTVHGVSGMDHQLRLRVIQMSALFSLASCNLLVTQVLILKAVKEKSCKSFGSGKSGKSGYQIYAV